MYMLMIIGVLLSILLVAIILKKIGWSFKFNISSPIFIFLITWIVAIMTCYLNIFENYNPLSLRTILFIIINILVIVLGYTLGKSQKFKISKIDYDNNKLLISFNILFIIVVISFLFTIYKLGKPPILGGIDKSIYYLPNGMEIFYLTIYLAFFIGFFLIKRGVSFKKLVIQLIILTLIVCLKSNKTGIFTILLLVLFFFGRKITFTKLLMIILGVFFIFGISSIMYYKPTNKVILQNAVTTITGYRLSNKLFFLFNPLIYLTCNLYNLNGLISLNLGGIGHGWGAFYGISHYLSEYSTYFNRIIENTSLNMNASLQIPSFNTYSGLGILYVGFGMILSVFIMFLLGWLSGILSRNKFNKNIVLIFLDFLIFETLSLSFFTFYLGNIEVISNILIVILIHIYARRRL